MDSAASILRQFLIEAQRRIPCHATAFSSLPRHEFHFHCPNLDTHLPMERPIEGSPIEGTHRSGGDSPQILDTHAVAEMLRGIVDTFLAQIADTHAPVIRNRVRYENGGPMIGRFLVAPVFDSSGEQSGIMLMYRLPDQNSFEQSDLKSAAQLSRQLARLLSLPADPVTGLMARAGLEKLVDWRLKSLGERANSSVLYGDIDQLHIVNDTFGFEAGDRAIAVVANALAAALADEDAVLSRLSADRFTIFLPGCPLERAQKTAARLRETVRGRSLVVGDDSIPLSICFGAAAFTNGERTFDHSLAAAELACKSAKERGRNRVEVYQVSDTSIIRRRDDISMVGRLRSALEEGRYQIFGQPIASLLTRDSVHRYEMLLRLIDEKGRLVLPASFMSSATRYQLLPQIDRYVIADVLKHLRGASTQPGFKPLHVSINLSGPTIGDEGFLDWVQMQLDQNGVSGDCITFELTETAALSNMLDTQLLMSTLGARGCRFALDDFGTGLSSLTHLKNLQFSSLKIDGSFIRDLLHNERSQSLVGAIAQLAGAMGMDTIAEYVETPEICMRLIELEVQYGQGYAIGKPRPLNGILAPAAGLLHAS